MLRGDFSGAFNYGDNALARFPLFDGDRALLGGGITLDRVDLDGRVHSSASAGAGARIRTVILANGTSDAYEELQELFNGGSGRGSGSGGDASVLFSGVLDHAAAPAVAEEWTLTLGGAARHVKVDFSGAVLSTASSAAADGHVHEHEREGGLGAEEEARAPLQAQGNVSYVRHAMPLVGTSITGSS